VWKIRYFQTARGEYPVKEFIEAQNLPIRAKIGKSIGLLRSYGPYLKPPQMKKLQRDLFELRVSGKVAIRIFYSVIKREFYLLHAFKKKSEKTPAKEIKIAIDRAKELT